MFEKQFDLYEQEFLQDLAKLLRIPSVSRETGDLLIPYGAAVKDALDTVAQIARRFGFEAENLGRVTQISFGTGEKKVYIACHADVVPCSAGWSVPPYDLTVRDGKLFGRGVLDNKGAVMAVLYALRMLAQAGIRPNVSLKLLVGGSEETTMSDMQDYVSRYGLPDEALTPDSVFPVVNTEAGMVSAKVYFPRDCYGKLRLLNFSGGLVSNAVPDRAEAEISGCDESVLTWLRQQTIYPVTVSTSDNGLILCASGISAHASEPQNGKNALIGLSQVLQALFKEFDTQCVLPQVLCEYFSDHHSQRLGLYCRGDILGEITQNVGVCNWDKGYFTVDMRLPVAGCLERITQRLASLAQEYGLTLELEKTHEYTHLDPSCAFLRSLSNAYTEQTGLKMEFLGSCGLTYAKAFAGRCVAFGPVYSEQGEECGGLHGDDEFVRLDVLKRLSVIYANVIKRLWCK